MPASVVLPPFCFGSERQVVQWRDVQSLAGEVARRHAGKVALRCGAEAWTFGELDRRARAVAAELGRRGIGRGDLVGVCAGRRPETLAGILGVLKAGAAYVPVDPEAPADRRDFTLRDAGVRVVVTERAGGLSGRLQGVCGECLDVDVPLPDAPDDFREAVSGPDDLVYVIYTSGSTGRPKGVRIPQRALTNFVQSMAREPGVVADDVVLALTVFSFDMCIFEIFLPLVTGAEMVVASDEMRRDGRLLAAEMARTGVTVMQGTPGTWRLLRETGWEGSRSLKILTGAEPVPRALVNDLVGRCASLWTMYGPTETTVWSTCLRLEAGEGTVPLGRPIDNTRVCVLDGDGALVAEGEVGELFIGGEGVALGYLGRPDLTAEKFLPDPFVPGGVMYRTGDLARWRGGILEFAGRADTQVKIRGFRVELGEIETRLESFAGVRQAVAVARTETSGAQRLVAYVSGPADLAEIHRSLSAQLPEYMIPALLLPLEEFPLNANGKVDRARLAELPLPVATGAPPETEWERRLQAIWGAVLGRPGVGCEENFFEAGGDSLQLGIVHARIMEASGREIPVTDLFAHPTIRAFARRLDGAPSAAQAARERVARRREALAARRPISARS